MASSVQLQNVEQAWIGLEMRTTASTLSDWLYLTVLPTNSSIFTEQYTRVTIKVELSKFIPLELLEPTLLHQNQWTKDCRLPPFQVSYHRKAARAPRPGSISTLGTLVTHTHYYQQPVWPQKLKKKDGSGHQRDNGGVWTTTGSSASKKGPPPSPPASRMSSAAQFGDDSSSGSGGGPAVETERVEGGATSEEAAASPFSPFSAAVFADPEQLLRRANFKKMRVYQTTGWHHDTAEVGCVVL